jgi:hypothetical protein
MAHTPYGYIIENGKAVVDEEKALQIARLFEAYIAGAGLKAAAESVGIIVTHSSIGRMLRNEKYLGTEFYPAIIDKVTFDTAEAERMKRTKELGRNYKYKDDDNSKIKNWTFKLGKVEQKYDSPFKQAEYAYSLIESEEADE